MSIYSVYSFKQVLLVNIIFLTFIIQCYYLFIYLFLFFPEAFEVCKRRVIALNGLPGIPQHFTDDERDIHMSSLVPFDSSNMVSLEQVSGLYPSRETAKTFLENLISSLFTAY